MLHHPHHPHHPHPPQPTPTPQHYILEDTNFDFRYVRPCDLDIPREKWLNCLQTVETLIRGHILWPLIWVCTVCQFLLGVSRLYWVNKDKQPNKDKGLIVQGPVVQSIVSLTSSLRVISLTILADSIYNILIFFAEKM